MAAASGAFIEGPVPGRLKVIHGFGGLAFGVKDSGFSFFLLLFYNQVLGMPAATVSLALLVALLVDAVIDPILGNLSDRTYTRWGRRLPWLYAAPIPLAFAWIALWTPTGGEVPTFWELLGIAVVVRLLLSACEVPSVSLLPEITADYDERTTLFRYRYLFGWLGGAIMMVLAYTVFMGGENGLLRAEGYWPFALTGAIIMAVSVLGSALGQHKMAAHLPAVRPPPFTIKAAFEEIFSAFREPAFLIFAAGGLAAYVSQGITFSISNYLTVFVWRLDATALPGLPEGATALMIYPLVLFLSVVAMFLIVGPLHRRFGKPATAAIGAIVSLVFLVAPYLLLLAGAWPQVGTLASAMLYYALLLVANCMGVVMMISASSMVAEIVEAHLERTGRRAEGAFYSGNWLIQKCATGLGIFVTGLIVSTAGLDAGADPAAIPTVAIERMIWLYAILMAVLALSAAYWLGRFPIGREQHEARLALLAEMARSQEVDPEDRVSRL